MLQRLLPMDWKLRKPGFVLVVVMCAGRHDSAENSQRRDRLYAWDEVHNSRYCVCCWVFQSSPLGTGAGR